MPAEREPTMVETVLKGYINVQGEPIKIDQLPKDRMERLWQALKFIKTRLSQTDQGSYQRAVAIIKDSAARRGIQLEMSLCACGSAAPTVRRVGKEFFCGKPDCQLRADRAQRKQTAYIDRSQKLYERDPQARGPVTARLKRRIRIRSK